MVVDLVVALGIERAGGSDVARAAWGDGNEAGAGAACAALTERVVRLVHADRALRRLSTLLRGLTLRGGRVARDSAARTAYMTSDTDSVPPPFTVTGRLMSVNPASAATSS